MLGYILIVMLVYIGIQIILYDRSYKKAMMKICENKIKIVKVVKR